MVVQVGFCVLADTAPEGKISRAQRRNTDASLVFDLLQANASRLAVLDLDHRNIGDEGMEEIAATVKKNNNLRDLHLSRMSCPLYKPF